MSNADAPKITAVQLDKQFAALKEAAATTIDPCLVAKVIAISDSRVRELFMKKVADGYLFRGINCINRAGVPENKYVVFDFDCIPGTFCLVSPAFMVVVNIIDRYVVAIVDPYIPSPAVPTSLSAPKSGSCGCSGSSGDQPISARPLGGCPAITIADGKACLSVPYAGDVCVSVPNWIPNGTIAEACVDTCKRFGILCGVKVTVSVGGQQVACQSWGCCDC
ncbi:MAG: hypothetical protein JWM11_7160 [Planctomycetaceae bacterium]|nr:hypothetical protein [Planctomycetaceae bacterium]